MVVEETSSKASLWRNFYKKKYNFDESKNKLGKAPRKIINKKK